MNFKTVYCMADPRDGLVRYVGCTGGSLHARLTRHLYDVKKRRRNTAAHGWIADLVQCGLLPAIHEIEKVPAETWQEAEIFWISEYRRKGHDLTNMTDGGFGLRGVTTSAETRRKISASNTGRSATPQAIQKMSDSAKNRPVSFNQAIAATLSGRKLPQTHKDNISAALLRRTRTGEEIEKARQSKRLNGPRGKAGFKGVCVKNKDSIVATIIDKHGKATHLGSFGSLEDAALARDNAMWSEYGTDCYLNFPERFVQYG